MPNGKFVELFAEVSTAVTPNDSQQTRDESEMVTVIVMRDPSGPFGGVNEVCERDHFAYDCKKPFVVDRILEEELHHIRFTAARKTRLAQGRGQGF